MSMLFDTYGRRVTNLRISVTDRCNFRCRYCMPEEGMVWLERGELLTYEEITRLARIFAGLGVEKIRLTGGEPLLRKDLWKLVRALHGVEGIRDLALTTNGYLLRDQAASLARAGLHRINVSLDSLDPRVFDMMTRRNSLGRVWEGIEEADRAGLHPIKLNVVLMRGINDGEILAFAELARVRDFVIRFIEYMPIGKDEGWSMDRVVPSCEVRDTIHAVYPLLPMTREDVSAPADRFHFADGSGEVGFISPVTRPFCGDCDRVRLTSDGKLRTCLFSLGETDLRALLRGGATDDEMAEAVVGAVWKKEDGHLINRPEFVRPERTMSQIGG